MLAYMRKHSKGWITKLIFGAIIIVFVAWGGSSYLSRDENKVAKIEKTGLSLFSQPYIISLQQYNKAYSDALEAYKMQYGDVFNEQIIKMLNVKEKVVDQLVNGYILDQEAKRLDISIGDAELQDSIQSIPAFVTGGAFDQDKYTRILSYYKLTPEQFEDQQRRTLIRERLYAIITDNVFVTPEEISATYRLREDTLDLNFITINPEQFTNVTPPAENEIIAYYESHKEAYKVLPKTRIAYVIFPATQYMTAVTVTPEEVRDYYEGHKSEFMYPAKIHARDILIKIPAEADEKMVQQKDQEVQKIYNEIKAGSDFAQMATKYSQDPETSAKGGDLGWLEKEKLEGALGDILMAAKAGEVKQPVRERSGFHIVKLEEKQEAKPKPFEEVSAQIMLKLQERKAKDMAYKQADKAFKAIYETPKMDLVGYARQNNLQLVEPPVFSEREQIAIPMGFKVVKDAFSRPEGDMSDPMDVGSGYMLYKVLARIPARIPELKEVRDRVIADVMIQKKGEAAKAYAKSLTKESIAALEAKNPESTGSFKRQSYSIPKLGSETALIKDLDTLKQPKDYAIKGKYYVVWLKAYNKADKANLKESDTKSIREELLRKKKEAMFETFMKQAKARYTITTDMHKVL